MLHFRRRLLESQGNWSVLLCADPSMIEAACARMAESSAPCLHLAPPRS